MTPDRRHPKSSHVIHTKAWGDKVSCSGFDLKPEAPVLSTKQRHFRRNKLQRGLIQTEIQEGSWPPLGSQGLDFVRLEHFGENTHSIKKTVAKPFLAIHERQGYRDLLVSDA